MQRRRTEMKVLPATTQPLQVIQIKADDYRKYDRKITLINKKRFKTGKERERFGALNLDILRR